MLDLSASELCLNFVLGKSICERTLERKGYLRRISKNLTSTNSSVIQDKKHLFQALLLIGLDLSSTKEKLPYIKLKCPKDVILFIFKQFSVYLKKQLKCQYLIISGQST